MKASLGLANGVVALLMMLSTARAVPAGDTVSVTGEAKCAKCALKEGDKCQTIIQSDKDGEMATYYLTANDTSDGWHDKICERSEKWNVSGTVREHDGKIWPTTTKIESASE